MLRGASQRKTVNCLKNIIYIVFLAASLLAGMATGAQAGAPLQTSVSNNVLTLTLQLSSSQTPEVFTVTDPDRLVVDVATARLEEELSIPPNYKGKLLRSVRSGQFNPTTARIVFELSGPATVLKAATQISRGKATLTIAITPSGRTASATTPEAPAVKKEKPLIVIDPGHGGIDPGASGSGRGFEKDIVLEHAFALKRALLDTGRYRVLLTREGDHFIRLRDRVEIARKAGASLFISLHADSAEGKSPRGLSVYTVSDEASDKESEALAAKENKADVLAGFNLAEEQKDVADILISLAQRETKNNSSLLADTLVKVLRKENIKLLENPHRFAGFAVLKAPDVPSVLVEIGFISNKEEEKLLKSKTHRIRVSKGLAKGIDSYMRNRKTSDTP